MIGKKDTDMDSGAIDRALSFLDACVKAGELHPEGAENPCDVWMALNRVKPSVIEWTESQDAGSWDV